MNIKKIISVGAVASVMAMSMASCGGKADRNGNIRAKDGGGKVSFSNGTVTVSGNSYWNGSVGYDYIDKHYVLHDDLGLIYFDGTNYQLEIW